ncbi:MAG: phage integrase SAM-like domain-containing protein [Janthinobacterium lividum]
MAVATYTVVLRPARASDGLHAVALRITKDRKAVFANTGAFIQAKHWNPDAEYFKANWVRTGDRSASLYNDTIRDLLTRARELALGESSLTAEQLRDRVTGKASAANPDELDFVDFFARFVARLQAAGNPRTAKRRQSILTKLRAFAALGKPEGEPARLPFKDLTVSWVKDYQAHLSTHYHNAIHTINKELQIIHTVLKVAIADGLLDYHKDPFLHIRLKHPKTVKVRLTQDEVAQLEGAATKPGWETIARDCWLIQFHCQGTRVGDILELRHRNIGPDRLTYLERKTGKTKNIPRHPRLNAVLARYPLAEGVSPDSYLLPILDYTQPYTQPADPTTPQAVTQQRFAALLLAIESGTALVNRYIKKAAQRVGIEKALTSHTARHSFADAARVMLGGNVLAIKEMLNHAQVRTTEMYLSDLQTSELDEATLSVYGNGTTPVQQPPNAPEQPLFNSGAPATDTPLAA